MPKKVDYQTSIVVLKNKDGKILAVSRSDDLDDFNFPGGRLDEGETFEQAAIREIKEETGLDISNLKEIHRGIVDKGKKGQCEVAAFIADYSGKIIPYSNEGLVKWVDPEDILAGKYNVFAKKVFKKMRK